MVKQLNDLSFSNEVLNNSATTLVDFYADWCGPCKMLSPIVEEIAEENTDIFIGKVNVDESPSLAEKYKVFSIPTLIVFKSGKEIARMVGLRSKEAILAELRK